MNSRLQRSVSDFDYKIIGDPEPINILDDDYKNSTEILIAELVGSIPKRCSAEYQQLSSFAYYPPLDKKQIQQMAIDKATSNEVQNQIAEQVFKKLETIHRDKTVNWNSIAITAAKRFVRNTVEHVVETMRKKLLDSLNHDDEAPNIIVQRFILDKNLLKII